MKAYNSLLATIWCGALMGTTCIAEPPSNAAPADINLRANNGAGDRVLSVRSLTVASSGKSSQNSRNQSPAIIGGPANKSRSAAVINGTGMKRKP